LGGSVLCCHRVVMGRRIPWERLRPSWAFIVSRLLS
jgi:hypothetical protein